MPVMFIEQGCSHKNTHQTALYEEDRWYLFYIN